MASHLASFILMLLMICLGDLFFQATLVCHSIVGCRKHVSPPLEETALGLYDSGIPIKQSVSESVPFWDLAKTLSETLEKELSKKRQFTEMPVLDSLFSSVHRLDATLMPFPHF